MVIPMVLLFQNMIAMISIDGVAIFQSHYTDDA